MSWSGLRDIALLGLAGALGAIARYGMNNALQALSGTDFPWGIFTVNICGCFIFGFIWELGTARGFISNTATVILLTGFVGAFTTFSTLISDMHIMLQAGRYFAAACSLGGQLLLGIAALRLGMLLVRLF